MNVHRFAIGQSVRLKGRIGMSLSDRRHVQDHRENACKGLVASISDQQRRGTPRARCGGKQSRRVHRCCRSKALVGPKRKQQPEVAPTDKKTFMIAFENNDWIVESYGMRATLLPGTLLFQLSG